MKNYTLILVLIVSTSSLYAQIPSVLDLPVPKSYTILKTDQIITVDGKAERAWLDAPWTDLFIDIEGEKNPPPYFDTRVKMLWDDEFIYFLADLEEEHIWGDITERDAVIFHNNDFEIFIKPNQFQPFYGEFEVNVLGTLWELFLIRPYRRNGPVLDRWDVNGTKIGIDIQGTLNDPSDTDKKWMVEMAIPLDAIGKLDRGSSVEIGSIWRINFSRVQWQYQIKDGKYSRKTDSNGNRLSENNWVWTPQSAIDMHRPEHWGYLYFADSEESPIESDAFKNEYQFLFYLYRHYLNTDEIISSLTLRPVIVNRKKLTYQVNETRLGFEITVQNENGDALTINQDGFIILNP